MAIYVKVGAAQTAVTAVRLNTVNLSYVRLSAVEVFTPPPSPKGMFYAGDVQKSISGSLVTNKLTQISDTGTLLSAEKTIGTSRRYVSGMRVNATAIFVGYDTATRVTRINYAGNLIAAEHTISSNNRNKVSSAALDSSALLYGDENNASAVTSLSEAGSVLAQSNLATAQAGYCGAGTRCGDNGSFYSGSRLVRINSSRVRVGTEQTITCFNSNIGAASPGDVSVAIYYTGYSATGHAANSRFTVNSAGAVVASIASIGTGRWDGAGASIGVGLFYGGRFKPSSAYDLNAVATRIGANGAMIGTETNIGTARAYYGGAGFQ